jgi:hypothetical protein
MGFGRQASQPLVEIAGIQVTVKIRFHGSLQAAAGFIESQDDSVSPDGCGRHGQ